MALTDEQKRSVEKTIKDSLRKKFKSYDPESKCNAPHKLDIGDN